MPHASAGCSCPQCRNALSGAFSASGSSSEGAAASASGVYYVDALLAGGGTYHWNTTIGTAASVSYSFLTSVPLIYAGEEESVGFAAFNSAQQSAARAALALWSDVANISFTETTGSLGDIRFGTAYLTPTASAWAYYPGTGSGGDVWINNYYESNASPAVGNYAFGTIIHELGHALGLKHPGDYNAGGGGTEGPYLPSAEDSTQYTVMSYTNHATVTAVDAMTPMLYDIAAIQYLYGVNTSTRSSNTTYAWGAGEVVLEALWDGGGTDTIDASNQTASQTIDLRAGYFSSIAGQSNNVAIAYGAVIENALGGSGADRLIGNTSANTLDGGAGDDALESGGGDDTLTGGAGADWVTLGDAGGAVLVSGVETLRGGAGADVVTLSGSSNALFAARLETLYGSAGGDWITLTNIGHTMTVSGIETLRGGGETDIVTLGGAGNTMIVAALETLLGGGGRDAIILSNLGSSTTIAGLEQLTGGAGGDWITIANPGATMTVSGIETLRGGGGVDIVTLGGAGNTMIVAALDVLVGSAGGDWITISNLGSTMTVAGIETLRGGAGADVVTLSAASSMIVAGLDALTGSSGGDWITLSNIGHTMTVSGIETLRGGGGADVVTLGGGGNTMIVAALDTLIGGAGTDVVTLSNSGATLSVSGIESLTGGGAADVAVVAGGSIRFQGQGGADALTLLAGAGADTVAFGATTDGGALGSAAGFDVINNFQAATDRVQITGALRTAIDDNGDGILTAAVHGSGGVSLFTDEIAVLSATAAQLDDADFAAFQTALGSLVGTAAGASALVLATDGTNSGLYYIVDAEGNGVISAGEIRLLGKFNGAVLSAANLSFG